MSGRILIVEDDRAITQSLARLLSREDYYIQGMGSAEEALAHLAADAAYDLALLDVALPGMNGFACCREMRARGWRQPILMLTGRGHSQDKVSGLEVGADDYITKPFDPAELLARIHAHLRRVRDYNAPSDEADQITLRTDCVLDLRVRDAFCKGRPVCLTDREYELLLLLARHHGTALDKNWLFQQIWGCAPALGIKALAVYVRRLRQKIEEDADHPRCVLTVRGYGYKLVTDEDSDQALT